MTTYRPTRRQMLKGAAAASAAALLSSRWMRLAAATAPDARANLALVATPSSSYTSGDTSLAALNDGFAPRTSRDTSHGTYGNWNRTGTQWIDYTWTQPISTNQVEIYWWNDGAGIGFPSACRLSYWDGKQFVPVANASGLGLEGNQFNITTFDEVTTTRLRLEIDASGRSTGTGISTGIIEYRVIDSGKSPAFPPTVVAGIDRSVVIGGKTYLSGKVKALASSAAPAGALAWSKLSGPGAVTFADEHAPVTTAKFATAGDYVLQLQASAGSMTSADKLHVRVVEPPPAVRWEPVYLQSYKIDSPVLNSRLKTLITAWIPHIVDKLSDLNLREGGINNFIQAGNKLAGQAASRHVGYPFANAYVHNAVESMCVALLADAQGDAEILAAQAAMRVKLDDWIPLILAAQESDGYLQTRFTLNGGTHWDPRTRTEHEGYTAGYFLEAALAHFQMTGKKDSRFYDAAKRLADCWAANLGPAPKKAWYDGHQEMEQALVRFGRFVNDHEGAGKGDNYIKLAQWLLDCRGGGTEYDQSHLPVIQQYEAVGHAVRATYLYSGMADIALETHDPDYQSAVLSLWDDMVNRKYYVTGGIGSGETSEGFGKDYSLRNAAYCESCSNCGVLFLQHKMNLTYQDGKFADLIEDTYYNAILGDFDLSGQYYNYTNPLDDQGGNGAMPGRGNARYAWHTCPCCVGNFPRVLLMAPTWTYAKSPDGLVVNLFVGSTVNISGVAGTDVQVIQKTEYPLKGAVSLTINPAAAKEFTLRIRVPNRGVSTLYSSTPAVSGLTSVAVNGSTIKPDIKNGYAVITRTWRAGDKIDLAVPLEVQRVKADTHVAADKNRVALRYGPLVYNLESVDGSLDRILDPNSPLTSTWSPDLLGGAQVVKGQFTDESPLIAIPNYLRLNRGGRSIVWLRDA